MNGIYITGISMPEDGWHKVIKIFRDGTVVSYYDSPELGKAIPVPDHGRLIDADAFKKRMMQGAIDAREDALTDEIWLRILDAAKSLCLDIDEQPTIIPASKEGKR